MSLSRTAIVGAGVAGLVCARELHGHAEVVVFDKARGAGGRTSTRRNGEHRFDHGAQFITARDDRFRAEVRRWVEGGVAALWRPRWKVLGEAEDRAATPATAMAAARADDMGSDTSQEVERFVGTPGMSAIAGELARGTKVQLESRVARMLWDDGGWRLLGDPGANDEPQDLGWFDRVLFAIPAPQAVPLLAGVPWMQRRIQMVEMTPCLAVMVVLPEALALEWDVLSLRGDAAQVLSWVARNDSKARRPQSSSYVLHASPAFSAAHIDADAREIESSMLRAFAELTGRDLRPRHTELHRWRFARATAPLIDRLRADVESDGNLEAPCIYDGELGLGVCGDWVTGERVEDAYLSGLALAQSVVDWHRESA